MPNFKAQANNEFILWVRKGNKKDDLRFSSDHRAEILSEALKFSNIFMEKIITPKVN